MTSQPGPETGVFTNVDPFANAEGHSSDHSSDDAPAEPKTRSPDDSEGPRAGTGLFVNTSPYAAHEDGHNRQSGSDSGSGNNDEKEEITQMKTHHSSSHNVLDKIATAAKEKFHLQDLKATGPSKFFNPTNVRMRVRWHDHDHPSAAERVTSKEMGILWRSRDNRKGRNSIFVPREANIEPNHPFKYTPQLTSSLKEIGRNLYRMVCTFPYWDMAFWSGWSYTWGSVLFVIDGIWAWIPTAFKNVESKGVSGAGVGFLFFFGAIFYEIGATMAYFEAVNDGSFHGSAMRRFLEGHEEDQKKMMDAKIHDFFGHLVPHHSHKNKEEEEADDRHNHVDPEAGWKSMTRRERPGSIYPTGKAPAPRRGGVDLGEAEEGESSEYLTWRWWPTWKALKGHHVYEIGYIACAVQLFGATLYGMCGVIALPGIIDVLSDFQLRGAYWSPEIIASVCFLIASLLFTLETQEKWYKPEFRVLGWWIGAWATVGSMGFLMTGIFGLVSTWGHHWAEYQSDLSSTWGSFGYLCSSLLQWYEAVNKHPVEELFNEPGEMKSHMVHPV